MSDWGRGSSGERQGSGRERQGSGRFGAFVVGVLFGVVLLVAAVIGVARAGLADLSAMLGGVGAEQVESLKQEVARLRERAATSPQLEDLRQRAEKGEAALAALKRERDALASGQSDAVEQLRTELESLREGDIPKLEAELGTRDRRLGEMEAKLKLAEDVTGELQSQLGKAFNEEIPALKRQLEQRDALLKQYDGELTAKQAEIASLQTQLKQAEQGQRSAEDARARDAGRNEALAAEKARAAQIAVELDSTKQALAARDALLKQYDDELAARQGEVAALNDRLKAAEAAAEAAAGDKSAERARQKQAAATAERLQQAEAQVATLSQELESRKQALAARDKAIADEIASRDAAVKAAREAGEKAAREDAGQETSAAQAQIASLEAELAQIRAEKEELVDKLATLSRQPPAKEASRSFGSDKSAKDAQQKQARELTPRDPLRVAQAMRDALGLDALAPADRDRIATGLIEGECVSRVLGEVFGKAPAVSTRDLIGALDSDC